MPTSSLISMEASISASSEFSSFRPWRHWGTDRLCIYHRTIVNGVLAKCQASVLGGIDWLLEMENKAPFA